MEKSTAQTTTKTERTAYRHFTPPYNPKIAAILEEEEVMEEPRPALTDSGGQLQKLAQIWDETEDEESEDATLR